jgi:hypothetical protein
VRPSVVAAQRYHAATFIVRRSIALAICRIGVMRALNRHVERVFNPARKDHHWGRRKLARYR